MLVRERPPLRLDIDVETPTGRHIHWAESEADPAHVLSALTFSSTMPGGYAEMGATLPRKRGLRYDDLDRLSTVTVYGPGGAIAWQGRLERAPRSSGDRMSVSPGCVGWQAHLEDDKSPTMIYVDKSLERWGGISRQRKINLLTALIDPRDDAQQIVDQETGKPALRLGWTGPMARTTNSEGLYDPGPGNVIGSIWWRWTAPDSQGNTAWTWLVGVSTTDGISGTSQEDANQAVNTPTTGTGTFTPSISVRYGLVRMRRPSTGLTAGQVYEHYWELVVFGDHGLTKRGTVPDQGFYASDVVAHAVQTWCPLLNYSTGAGGTIRDSSFVIPHLAFPETTTAAEIIRGADRFHLSDWAVWDNRTFYYAPRGEFGRSWRARASESQLEETGADTARLYNGALVEYRDVDGSTRTVGPTGSGADTESTDLVDDDTENPANQIGIRRWTKLQMGTSTPAGATEVGRRFLEETKALDSSGRARLVGHVQDDRGVLHPAWRVRAGDTISFTDAGDASARRIVSASYSHADRSCSVDLDAPPDSLAALLERLDVVLVPLGL